MKQIITNLLLILCIVQFVIILLLRECEPQAKPCPEVETLDSISETTQIVDIPGKVEYKPVPVYVHDTVHDTIFRTHDDTLKAMRDYSLSRIYKLPILHDDTIADIDFFATVQYNQIQKYHFEGKLYPRHTYELKQTFVKEEPRIKVFTGLQAGMVVSDSLRPILMPSVAILTKKEHLYSFSYEPFINAFMISSYWKIRIKPP